MREVRDCLNRLLGANQRELEEMASIVEQNYGCLSHTELYRGLQVVLRCSFDSAAGEKALALLDKANPPGLARLILASARHPGRFASAVEAALALVLEEAPEQLP